MTRTRLLFLISAVAVLLLIPFIAMQFTDEVQWTFFDFAVAAVLLLGTGLLSELILRKVTRLWTRFLTLAFLFAVLLLVWIELAVGVFGTPFAGT